MLALSLLPSPSEPPPATEHRCASYLRDSRLRPPGCAADRPPDRPPTRPQPHPASDSWPGHNNPSRGRTLDSSLCSSYDHPQHVTELLLLGMFNLTAPCTLHCTRFIGAGPGRWVHGQGTRATYGVSVDHSCNFPPTPANPPRVSPAPFFSFNASRLCEWGRQRCGVVRVSLLSNSCPLIPRRGEGGGVRGALGGGVEQSFDSAISLIRLRAGLPSGRRGRGTPAPARYLLG